MIVHRSWSLTDFNTVQMLLLDWPVSFRFFFQSGDACIRF